MASRLGRRLRERRARDLQKTLNEIAQAMGVKAIYVSDIERGRRVPLKPDTLRAIARAYGISEEEVRQLATESQDAFSLEANNEARRETAIALARTWADLSDEQLSRLRRIAEEADGEDQRPTREGN